MVGEVERTELLGAREVFSFHNYVENVVFAFLFVQNNLKEHWHLQNLLREGARALEDADSEHSSNALPTRERGVRKSASAVLATKKGVQGLVTPR